MAGLTPVGPGDLPRLLRDAAAEARSGRLELAELAPGNPIRRAVHFEGGHLALVSSSATAERLGETLVRSGRLQLFELVRATTIVARDHKRLGEVLREAGLLDAGQLCEALTLQARTLLQRVLLVQRLSWKWTRGEPTGEPTLPTASLFQGLAGAATDSAAMRHAIGGDERVLRRAIPPRVLGGAAPDALQQELLRRLDLGAVSARALVDGASANELAVQRALVGLLCLGQVT